jgi:hypothetical protein
MTHLIGTNPLPFAPGDRISREEFLDRWERMPDLKFAELIDGVVCMPSPVSPQHARLGGLMHTLLGVYAAFAGVCEMLPHATWLMLESAPQPDVALRLLPQFGGRTDASGKLCTGAPELIAEAVLSSRSYDLGPKLALYQRAGVAEYVAALIEEQRIEWRVLEGGHYTVRPPTAAGIHQSLVFPGLWLDEPAFWAADSRQLLSVLDQGLASDECSNFLARVTAGRA